MTDYNFPAILLRHRKANPAMATSPQIIAESGQGKKFRIFQVFLMIISVAGLCLAIYATTPFGAGVSGDAASNLSTAENLLRGKGFVDLFGNPLVYWAPLYSIILAGLGIFTHKDIFFSGWYLNILLTGLNIYFSGRLLYLTFRSQPLFQYIGCLFVFLSVSSFRVHVNIASDPLYITFSLLFLIAAGRYMETSSKGALRAIIFYSALASLQRFVGVILIVTGSCLIAYQNWKNWKVMILENLKFGIPASLPLALWIIGHNLGYGVIGGNPSNLVQPWENTRMSLLKIMHWFIPIQFFPNLVIRNPWILLLALFLILLLLNKRRDWFKWREAILSPYTFPAILFFFLSILTLIYSISTPDHRLLESDRYYVGLLVPTLVLIFITWEYLIFPHLKLKQNLSNKILILLFILWSIYPLYGFQNFIKKSQHDGGVASYNTTNTRETRDSKIINYLDTLLNENTNIALYSNDPRSVWFVTRQDVQLLPWLVKGKAFDSVMAGKLASWPPQKEAYVIWLIPDSYEVTVTPDELSHVTIMNLIYSAPDGNIYFVHTKDK